MIAMAMKDDMTLEALAKVLIKRIGTPEMRKVIRDAKTFTRVEDRMFIERLERLKHEIEQALASQDPSCAANRAQE